MTQIFVYGTLKDEQVRKMVLGYETGAEFDVLEDYKVVPHSVFLRYPTIEKAKGEGTNGYVFESRRSLQQYFKQQDFSKQKLKKGVES